MTFTLAPVEHASPIPRRRPSIQTATHDTPARAVAYGPGPVYAIEALASTGGTLFTIGAVFYTHSKFGWGMAENFRLAAAQGAVYVVGALLAHPVAGRLDHRRAAVLLHVLMAAACVVGAWAGHRSDRVGVTAVLLAYTLLSAVAWPILESLVSMGADAATLARRLATYNVVWPGGAAPGGG